jgi:predicted nucleic acid-binding Zn ribbon protein
MKETEKFSDESDRASAIEAAAIDVGIEQARIKANTLEFEPTGFCLNCNEPLAEGHRFCDKDCADDHAKRLRK